MPELIDRQAALRLCKDADWEDDRIFIAGYNHAIRTMTQALTELPTIEAEPVRHGRWAKSDVYIFKKCSECGAIWDAALCENIFFIYCPRCGSKNGGADNG